jgi:hypothetical protein
MIKVASVVDTELVVYATAPISSETSAAVPVKLVPSTLTVHYKVELSKTVVTLEILGI